MQINWSFKQSITSIILKIGLLYLFYSVCRLVFYFINQGIFGSITAGEWFNILRGGVYFDTSAIAYLNAIFILGWLLPFRSVLLNPIYKGIMDTGFLLVNIVGLLLNVVDFYYFEFNLKRLTADFGHWVGESNVSLILGSFASSHWYVVFLLIALIGAFIYLYRKIPYFVWGNPSVTRFVAVQLVTFAVMIGLVIAGMRGGFKHSTRPITLSNAGAYVKKPEYMPIVLNTPFSIIRTIDKKAYSAETFMNESEARTIFDPVKNYHHPADSFRALNVVILILESYSKEHSGLLNPDLDGGQYKGYTPFLDSLMKQSLVCTNAFANGRKSIDAMPSVLAGLPSLIVPYVLSHNSLDKINSLASLLQPKGYQSVFAHGAPNGSMGFEAFSKIAHFDQYWGKTEYNNDDDYDGIWGIWDEEFLQFFDKSLSTLKSPFLGVCFTLSSHHPFEVPTRYTGKFDKGKLPVHQNVGYTDYALKRFFESASQKEWYKNTLFVITADHSTVAWSQKYNSSVGAFSIPILYYLPGGNLKGEYEKVTQQTDIMPTILDILNFDQSFVAFGNSILDTSANHFALNYINDQYQCIVDGEVLTSIDGKKLTGLNPITSSMEIGESLLGKNSNLEKTKLTFLQAIIQQYNQRILKDKLTETQ